MSKRLLVEFIEIYINQILYLRGLYPRQIFKKCRAYYLAVYKNIYPPLNDYLMNSMKSIEHLLETKELRRIEVTIYEDDDKIQEIFVIDISKEFSIDDTDKYLIALHEKFRFCLYELESKCKVLKKINRSSKFKILLHTCEKAYQRLCRDSNYQDFLWIKHVTTNESAHHTKKIVPIASSQPCNFISLHIEH